MGLYHEVNFPCQHVPVETRKLRLLGIYSQRPEGLLLQRVKISAGRIGLDQWRGVARLVQQYTPQYPLHITTRQNIELHGIRPADVPGIQAGVANLGLTCVATAGDTVRNIVVCPQDGFGRGTWAVGRLVDDIRTHIESLAWIADLPRKFKMSVCGCQCRNTRPWIQDLGLVANRDGTFRAIAAGSLGVKPATGVRLFDSLQVEHVIPLVVALLRLFHAEGDRENRHRARLRHVRERLGDRLFADSVEQLFHEEVMAGRHLAPPIARVENHTPLPWRLSLPLGDVTPEEALELADVVEASDGELRLGLQHDLFVFGRTPPQLSPTFAEWTNNTTLVTCPGSAWCTRGIADSRGAARRLRHHLPKNSGVSIAVGGCLNNCSQAAVADIGLLGCVRRREGERIEGFRVLVGGGNGHTPALGRELLDFVPAADVAAAVNWLVREYLRCNTTDDLAFVDFCARDFTRLKDFFRCRFVEEKTI